MKKLYCYSKYTYFLPLAIEVAILTLSFLLFHLFGNDPITWKIIWLMIMVLSTGALLYSYLFLKQVVLFYSDRIVLKNAFGLMQQLNPQNCIVVTTLLPTEYSWATGITHKKWICIYEKNENIVKFKSGVSNGKKYKRIQVIYSEKNLAIINDFIK